MEGLGVPRSSTPSAHGRPQATPFASAVSALNSLERIGAERLQALAPGATPCLVPGTHVQQLLVQGLVRGLAQILLAHHSTLVCIQHRSAWSIGGRDLCHFLRLEQVIYTHPAQPGSGNKSWQHAAGNCLLQLGEPIATGYLRGAGEFWQLSLV